MNQKLKLNAKTLYNRRPGIITNQGSIPNNNIPKPTSPSFRNKYSTTTNEFNSTKNTLRTRRGTSMLDGKLPTISPRINRQQVDYFN